MTEFALPYTWIVTKSQPHADSLVIQLRRQGFRALAISCIEHQWRDWPELRRIGADGAAVLFVTSRAAAARIDVPQGITVAAIAPTTSATLEARGINVRTLRARRRARAGPGGARFSGHSGRRGRVLSHQ